MVHAVGGEHEPGAVVLVPRAAARAGAAGVDEVAHANRVPGLELGDAGAGVRGFENVKNMEGGYDAWVENDLAVKKPQAQDEL